MKVAVPKETAPGERRVALVPEIVSKLTASGIDVIVEAGAGAAASFSDEAFREAGAESATRGAPRSWRRSEAELEEADRLREGKS